MSQPDKPHSFAEEFTNAQIALDWCLAQLRAHNAWVEDERRRKEETAQVLAAEEAIRRKIAEQ